MPKKYRIVNIVKPGNELEIKPGIEQKLQDYKKEKREKILDAAASAFMFGICALLIFLLEIIKANIPDLSSGFLQTTNVVLLPVLTSGALMSIYYMANKISNIVYLNKLTEWAENIIENRSKGCER